jgi:hypothetical protein
MNFQTRHDNIVQELRYQLNLWKTGAAVQEAPRQNHSNIMRPKGYRGRGPRLATQKLNQVIQVDRERQIAFVEPGVTMEALAKATLPYGLIPPVIAEFKGITVGGAVMGTSLESSSHAHGQFNDACLGFEVLLGDGTIVWASPDEHPELFYGMSGSFGSLGILLLVELQLVPAEPYVKLSYETFSSVPAAIQKMEEKVRSQHPPTYLEAIVYRSDLVKVISADPVSSIDSSKLFPLNHYWHPWFYQQVAEVMPTEDYLFRHDRGAFWMGSYTLDFPVFAKFLFENYTPLPSPFSCKNPRKTKYPGLIFRSLFGWTLDSQRLYGILHSGNEQWFADHLIIQDFYLPADNTVAFVQEAIEETAIFPIWLCPIKSVQTPQHFSPHYHASEPLFFDVGVYGYPKGGSKAPELVRRLEKRTHELGGRKMFYSYSYMTPETFWQVYPKDWYDTLRQKYRGDGVFVTITDKILLQ